MSVHRIKLNYNGFIQQVAEALDSEDIEQLRENAMNLDVGIQLLNGYLRTLAEHAIETEDEWLLEWCKDLLIVTEYEEGGERNAEGNLD